MIIGAGIAGVAAAYALSAASAGRIALVDKSSPLSLTSDKSTECYRNFWPGPDSAMAEFVADSIELLHRHTVASRNQIQLHQRGYLFASSRPEELDSLQQCAEQNALYGGGELRQHQPGSSDARYRTSPTRGMTLIWMVQI